MEQYYLRIEDNSFGFVVESIHEIKETDIQITNEEYGKFFELQSKGKQFRLKETPTGYTLFDYVEEYIPEIIEDTTPSIDERLKALEMAMLEVL